MKTNFLIASVVAMASADWMIKDPYAELDVILDGQDHSLYIAQTHWTHIKDYDTPPLQPGDFEYGDNCASLYDEHCDGCSESGSCNWSWPAFSDFQDPWANDPQKGCRCMPATTTGDLGSEFAMGFNGRAYLSNTQMFDKNQFFVPNLLGGSMEYDVDLSEAGCNCNAAMYMIGMPAKNQNGSFRAGEDGMFYCDAAGVGGALCPEFDIMEANQYAYRAVNHHCNEPNSGGHYDWCDQPGSCAVDIITDHPTSEKHYGPGSEYTINTLQEFHIKVDFVEDSQGTFVQYSITLSQDGINVVMSQNCPEQLGKISDALKNGMTLAMSIWTDSGHPWGSMDWLHHGVCDRQAPCGSPDLKFRNLKFTTKNTSDDNSGDDSDDGNNDDQPVANPLEIYKTEVPAGMGRAKPRYTIVDRKKIPNEAADYASIKRKQCQNRAKAFDKQCHDFKGKGQQKFRDFRDDNEHCGQADVIEKFHCLAQQCAFEYCLSERDSYVFACQGTVPEFDDIYDFSNLKRFTTSNCEAFYEIYEDADKDPQKYQALIDARQ